MDRDEMLRRVEEHYHSFWQGDLDEFDIQLAPNFVDHETLGTDVGPGPVKEFATIMRGASSDMAVTVEQSIVEGDWIGVRATWQGTHTGPILGREATGRALKAGGMVFWRFDADGRIAERWAQVDSAALLAQIDSESVGSVQNMSRSDPGVMSATEARR